MSERNYQIDQQIRDLNAMIAADRGHLAEALAKGDKRAAARFQKAIADNQKELRQLS